MTKAKNLSKFTSRGQATVEVTLIFLLLVVLVGAAVDWGIGLFVSHVVQNAVREGARKAAASVTVVPGEIITEVQSRIPDTSLFSSFRDGANITVTGPQGTCPDENLYVTVQTDGGYNFWFLRAIGLTDPLTISRSTTMRYERQLLDCT